jgi:hypothetical protein
VNEEVMDTIEALITAIREGVSQNASAEQRTAGANACRAMLAVLEAKPGQPLAPAPATPAIANGVQAIVSLLLSAPPEQLLDLAIAKLRTMVPVNEQPATRAFSLHLVPVPKS